MLVCLNWKVQGNRWELQHSLNMANFSCASCLSTWCTFNRCPSVIIHPNCQDLSFQLLPRYLSQTRHFFILQNKFTFNLYVILGPEINFVNWRWSINNSQNKVVFHLWNKCCFCLKSVSIIHLKKWQWLIGSWNHR